MALRNKKGQSIIEAIFIFNAMLLMFFAMFLFSSFFYTRMIVIHAGNAAINEAVGYAPQGVSAEEVEDVMEGKAGSILQMALFSNPGTRRANAEVTLSDQGVDIIANFRIEVSARYSLTLPFILGRLADELLQYELEVDYRWTRN